MVLVHSSTSYSYVMEGDNYIVILIENYIILSSTIEYHLEFSLLFAINSWRKY